ncbi:hypothetical protein C2845_PM16G14660 [Panicum miliaceum]|uniref:Uncharacterized protein n=1 Tax=Panicum miliaceum TaxID=4540 RepID=A0A3L6Q2N3_PANMI|nr:hypothetical protein C2845_PM16G14660 [Panicum miliaceum]
MDCHIFFSGDGDGAQGRTARLPAARGAGGGAAEAGDITNGLDTLTPTLTVGDGLKMTRRMESVKMRPGTATKREYRRMEVAEEGEELDEAEWLHRAEAQSQRRRRGQRYAFGCALFASLNAILLGYVRATKKLSIAWSRQFRRTE